MNVEIGNTVVQIKKCPFCGNYPEVQQYYGGTGLHADPPGVSMKCTKCGAQTKIVSLVIDHKYNKMESAVEAISLWNLRV